MAWLTKKAAQWELYEEEAKDKLTGEYKGPETRHLHGRILLKDVTRMDKLKDGLCIALEAIQADRKVLLPGIKWLYDDFEYARKDGVPWSVNIQDEDDWIYADPRNKVEKKKNTEMLFYMALLDQQINTYVENAYHNRSTDLDRFGRYKGNYKFMRSGHPMLEYDDIMRMLHRHIGQGTIELPAIDRFRKKCEQIAYYYNYCREDLFPTQG